MKKSSKMFSGLWATTRFVQHQVGLRYLHDLNVIISCCTAQLLWHGSRLSNVVGILSKGLRVAPPEAPNNGYMFGKGVRATLFAVIEVGAVDLTFDVLLMTRLDLLCRLCLQVSQLLLDYTPKPEGETAFLLVHMLCAEEAEDLTYTSLKKTKGCDSTHGVGRMAAPEEDYETMDDGVVVPVGEFMPTDVNGSLLYNEFIVYRQEQVKLRYLVNFDVLYEEDDEA
ncbi:unnamed protein product [Phytophthora fragariaefolia]|uniref:Poly [ADP-ribose] polymerase n=1 Tax=Phytophthora fragariaefolia TaxID=1490495 RepID=A0A9W7D5S4_9STRA|nr:unnamed protein product [Phytophthora fragariaefolia]